MGSVLAAPLIVRDQGIGEVWIFSKNDFFYDQADLQVVVTAAGNWPEWWNKAF